MKTTRFKMQVQKRKTPPVDREELKLYWKGIIDLGKHEIVVDNFAGGGGAGTGIEKALGYSVEVAINHDPDAIAMHKVNHPETMHYCENVWHVDPRKVAAGRPVGLVWLSPDCTHHSKARGGKPRQKNIRGLAWVAVRWAATVKPRCIILENVEEFRSWGPLNKDGQPDPKQKGRTFKSFVNALIAQGYEVEYREMRACDYGAPTIRKRFFLIARCDGLPIVWPKPTHGPIGSEEVINGNRKPWRSAASIIDWSIPCPSIFERKKPLADNTLRRIAKGIMKYVINNPKPFIVNYKFDNEPENMNSPLSTITTVNNHYVVTPFIARIGQTGFNPDGTPHSINDPLSTVVTKAEHLLISPTLIQTGYGEREGQEPRALDLDKPLGTVVAGGVKHAVVAAHLVKHYGGGYDGSGNSIEDPLNTITTVDHNALVTALLLQYNTETTENGVRGQSVEEPLNTIPTANRYGLVTSNLVKLRGTNVGQSVDDPLHTITAGGNHHAEVRALLIAYYGASVGQSLDDPLGTVPTHDRFGLVTINSIDYMIVDVGMRMLEPHELYAANGFPSNYIIKDYVLANGKPVPKSVQVAKCGNSVPPQFSEALVLANLPHMCVGAGKKLSFERYKETTGQLQLSI